MNDRLIAASSRSHRRRRRAHTSRAPIVACHTHQLRKLVRPKPDQPDRLLRPCHGYGQIPLGEESMSTLRDHFKQKMFFIMVDAHSKWPEVMTMSSTTTRHTIDALTAVFARYGLPDQLVSDNGPQLTSCEFCHFLKRNGIKHILSAPYHPSSCEQERKTVYC